MQGMLNHIKRIDWIIAGSALCLSAFGLLSLFSSAVTSHDFSTFQRQGIFLFIGLLLMFFISFFDWRIIKNDSHLVILVYILCTLSLVGLLFFAPSIRGARAWYKIGGLSVDPIELMKLILVVIGAKYFSMRHIEIYRIRHIFLSGLYFALPIVLVFFQPNLGSALVLLALWLVLLLVAGIKLKHLALLLIVGLIIGVLGWNLLLHPYQKNRIISFLSPELDPLGIGWSQLQSKIAVGNGGIFGQGIGKGTQTQFHYLSEAKTDFIFAAIAEELGFLGVWALFLLFAVLLWRILKVGISAESNFPRLFVVGFSTVLIFQFFVNVGMNLGIFPIIGLPLPLVSYGGSSLIATYIGLGIVQSIRTY